MTNTGNNRAPAAAGWPVPEEAVRAWQRSLSGSRCCLSRQPPCFRPNGHDGDHGISDKGEWLRYGLSIVAPIFQAATLRQAAERLEQYVPEGFEPGPYLRMWADEVQP
jgi:hypothetical protein